MKQGGRKLTGGRRVGEGHRQQQTGQDEWGEISKVEPNNEMFRAEV